MSSSFQSLKAFVPPSLAKSLSSVQKPEYFKGGVAYIYIYIVVIDVAFHVVIVEDFHT